MSRCHTKHVSFKVNIKPKKVPTYILFAGATRLSWAFLAHRSSSGIPSLEFIKLIIKTRQNLDHERSNFVVECQG